MRWRRWVERAEVARSGLARVLQERWTAVASNEQVRRASRPRVLRLPARRPRTEQPPGGPARPAGSASSNPHTPPPPREVDGAPTTSDTDFPFLTFSQAARLRRLVRSAFAEHGIECTIDGGFLHDAAGNRYGLWNLAASLSTMDRSGWRDVVEDHVRIVLTTPGVREMPSELILSSLRMRLVDLDSVPFLEELPHVRALAPGLVEILTLDLPESVITPPAADLATLGNVDDLVSQGRARLLSMLEEPLETRTVRTDDGLVFTFVLGDSFYIASLALVLGPLLAVLEPKADLRKGIFVAVPNRHHLAYRIVDDLPSLMAVGPIASFALNGYDDGAGPVSPHVYWVRGEHWVQLTAPSGNEIAIHVPPELTAIVEED